MLAALFLRRPDLIVLDEPTNNLDRESRNALYEALCSWSVGLLVVSHDRELLNLMDRIVELTPHGARSYGGNYELYSAQRDAEAAAAQHDLQHAAKELRKARRDAQAAYERQQRRNSRGGKSREKGDQSRIALNARQESSQQTTARLAGTFETRLAERANALSAAQSRVDDRSQLDIALSPVELPAGKTVLEIEDVAFRYPGADARILEHVNLRLIGPERVALVGPNGSGKSTLLRLILGELQPSAGRLRLGVRHTNCLDQSGRLLDPRKSVLENSRARNPDVLETACRLTLARFLFRTDDVHRLAGSLSGGERLRAALACVLTGVNPPPFLILDEPTNHLDLESLANLEQTLRLYAGALLVVSHDAEFLKRIGIERSVNPQVRLRTSK